jgi:hypothetical protein
LQEHGRRIAIPGYRRHRPEATLLYRLVAEHYPNFRDRRAAEDRPLPRYVEEELEAYLKCGRFEEGLAQCGLGETAEPLIDEIVVATPDVIASVQQDLPKGFPQHVLDAILGGLSKSAKHLETMPAG